VGGIGNVHVESYNATGAAEVVALCDNDGARVAAQGERLNIQERYTDYHALLKSDVDAVSICVPNVAHAEVAIAALKAGKHVLLEKPMAMNAAEAAKIQEAAKKSGKVLQLGMSWRHAEQSRVVREYVEKGLLGEIYQMRAVMIRRRGIPGLGGWFTTKGLSGGGPLIDLGVHWFDLAMWLTGLWTPTAVSAGNYAKFGPRMGDYRYVNMWAGPPRLGGVFDVEDYSAGFVRFGAQATLSFEVAWACNACSELFLEILGDKGGARIQQNKPPVILTEQEGRPVDVALQIRDDVKGYHVQAATFLAACRGEADPAATGEQGLVVMKLIDAIYASSEAHKEVAIKV
jgi:predicted dehydrogenase